MNDKIQLSERGKQNLSLFKEYLGLQRFTDEQVIVAIQNAFDTLPESAKVSLCQALKVPYRPRPTETGWSTKIVGRVITRRKSYRFTVGGFLLGALGTAVMVGGSHLGLSMRGNGYDIGPAWAWGGGIGATAGLAIDHATDD